MIYMMLPIVAAAGQPTQNVAAPAVDASKKICRMIVPTGTIMARRFCLTKREWDDLNGRTEASAGATLGHRGTGTCDVVCDKTPRATAP